MKNIDPRTLKLNVTDMWTTTWFLLTAGDRQNFNAMTIGWGSMGVMWNKPFIQVVVRPGRYTFEYMEKYPTFTVCAFPKQYRKALTLLGTTSGRDSDKIEESGLTTIESKKVDAPSYKEAELILECKKMYRQDMNPEHFLDSDIMKNYPNQDFHRIYFGEIVGISADERFIG
ncbi:MAG TPA: flavin reductase family protein [Deltaproteobacteria bacterium]|nr:flavin reductase family protein [Deltaproteobacteria bacterium]